MAAHISKSRFKAKALEIFRTIEQTGESVIVTDHGRPSLEVRPYKVKKRSPLEVLRGSVIAYKQPFDPAGEDEWEALQ
jgi:antitoxin (DNA-binding transcriptional repressor) of toxin-antitoxin stability system